MLHRAAHGIYGSKWQILRYKCFGVEARAVFRKPWQERDPCCWEGIKEKPLNGFCITCKILFLSLNYDNSFSITDSSSGFLCCALLYRTDVFKQRISSKLQWKWVAEQRWQCLHLSLFFTLLLWRFQPCFFQIGLGRVHPVLHGNTDIRNVKVCGWAELSQLHIL